MRTLGLVFAVYAWAYFSLSSKAGCQRSEVPREECADRRVTRTWDRTPSKPKLWPTAHGQVGTNMVFMPGHKCQFPMHVCHYLDSCFAILLGRPPVFPRFFPVFYIFMAYGQSQVCWTFQLLSHLACRVPFAPENRGRRRLQLWACLWLVSLHVCPWAGKGKVGVAVEVEVEVGSGMREVEEESRKWNCTHKSQWRKAKVFVWLRGIADRVHSRW